MLQSPLNKRCWADLNSDWNRLRTTCTPSGLLLSLYFLIRLERWMRSFYTSVFFSHLASNTWNHIRSLRDIWLREQVVIFSLSEGKDYVITEAWTITVMTLEMCSATCICDMCAQRRNKQTNNTSVSEQDFTFRQKTWIWPASIQFLLHQTQSRYLVIHTTVEK